MRVVVVATITLALSGCAHSVKEIARESSAAAVDQSVEQLTDEETKKEVAEAAHDPRVEAALKAMADHVTEAILRSLESERAQKQVAALTAVATRSAAQQLVNTLSTQHNRAQLESLTGGLIRAALQQASSSLKTDISPALRESLETELARGVENGLRGPLGAAAQQVAYHATLGANDGLRTAVWMDGGPADQARAFSERGLPWLKLAFWSLALLALILVSAAIIVIARARRARHEVRRLESATLLLATAMRERHASPETDEIVTVVREALEKSAEDHRRHGLLAALRLRGHHHPRA